MECFEEQALAKSTLDLDNFPIEGEFETQLSDFWIIT